jgi:hypothetical protein
MTMDEHENFTERLARDDRRKKIYVILGVLTIIMYGATMINLIITDTLSYTLLGLSNVIFFNFLWKFAQSLESIYEPLGKNINNVRP